MKIDCHTHLISVAPENGCYVSPSMRRSLSMRYLTRYLGLHKLPSEKEQDAAYAAGLAHAVEASEIDRAVVLAFDAVYDRDGQKNAHLTQLHVPNDYALRMCARYPDQFLFGASVHPYKKNALEELEKVAEQGAKLVKLLPNSHGFNPSDPQLIPYYQKMADLKLPMLIHCGYEHTIAVINQSFGRPLLLRTALDQGVSVIVAHVGSAGLFHFNETFGEFLSLLKQYSNCYGDTSALANIWRCKYLFELLNPAKLLHKHGLAFEFVQNRLLHGSDYPIIVTPNAFLGRIQMRKLRTIKKIENAVQIDVALKRAVGIPDACLTRFFQLFF